MIGRVWGRLPFSQGDRSTDQERTPIAAHEGVLAGGIEALCEPSQGTGASCGLDVGIDYVRCSGVHERSPLLQPRARRGSGTCTTRTASSGQPTSSARSSPTVTGRRLSMDRVGQEPCTHVGRQHVMFRHHCESDEYGTAAVVLVTFAVTALNIVITGEPRDLINPDQDQALPVFSAALGASRTRSWNFSRSSAPSHA